MKDGAWEEYWSSGPRGRRLVRDVGQQGNSDAFHRYPGLSRQFNIYVGAAYVVFAILMVVAVNVSQRSLALEEARQKSRILLDRNLATHHYFSKELKPSVFPLAAKATDEKRYFDPAWMSSTYAVRRIDDYFHQLEKGNTGYYYKECAINARFPRNEADVVERSFIEQLNGNSRLTESAAVREIDGKRFFVVLRRGETMEKDCLRCHSLSGAAPSDLVASYGSTPSFGRHDGEVVSAISIRIPLEMAYAKANELSMKLGGILLVALISLFAVQTIVARRFLLAPLRDISRAADDIASDERKLGETVSIPEGRELATLATAFNAMSTSLSNYRDHMEQNVEERTLQYKEVNRALTEEIELRRTVERGLQEKNRELEEAHGKVRVLSGFLPICASCKKIRDDAGYWDSVESYITRHSEAVFSHGLCHDCMEKLYPGYGSEK